MHGLAVRRRKLRPHRAPLGGAKLLSSHRAIRFALHRRGQSWRAVAKPVANVAEVAESAAATAREVLAGVVGLEVVDVGFEVHRGDHYTKWCRLRQHRPVFTSVSTVPMSDMALIRRQNFAALCKARSWSTPAAIKKALGWGRPSFWADLQKDAGKSFGEKLARRIESAAELPRDALDAIGAMPTSTGGVLPLREREDALLAAWRALSADGRDSALDYIENLVLTTRNATSDALEKLRLLKRTTDAQTAGIAPAPPAPPPPPPAPAPAKKTRPKKNFNLGEEAPAPAPAAKKGTKR